MAVLLAVASLLVMVVVRLVLYDGVGETVGVVEPG